MTPPDITTRADIAGTDDYEAIDYTYGYDADGNLTSASVEDANGSSSGTATYNDADELTSPSTTTYDPAGNETTMPSGATLGYNVRSQTVEANLGGGTSYPLGYDGTTQDLLNSDEGASLANTLLGLGCESGGGETAYFTRTPSGALISMRVDGTSYYYITNYQSSVIALTDNTGIQVDTFAYDPFGNLIFSDGIVGEPFGYTGASFDAAVGLYHLGARFYSPGQGNFTQLAGPSWLADLLP